LTGSWDVEIVEAERGKNKLKNVFYAALFKLHCIIRYKFKYKNYWIKSILIDINLIITNSPLYNKEPSLHGFDL